MKSINSLSVGVQKVGLLLALVSVMFSQVGVAVAEPGQREGFCLFKYIDYPNATDRKVTFYFYKKCDGGIHTYYVVKNHANANVFVRFKIWYNDGSYGGYRAKKLGPYAVSSSAAYGQWRDLRGVGSVSLEY